MKTDTEYMQEANDKGWSIVTMDGRVFHPDYSQVEMDEENDCDEN